MTTMENEPPRCDYCGSVLKTQDEKELGVCQSEINAWPHTKTPGTCNGNHMEGDK